MPKRGCCEQSPGRKYQKYEFPAHKETISPRAAIGYTICKILQTNCVTRKNPIIVVRFMSRAKSNRRSWALDGSTQNGLDNLTGKLLDRFKELLAAGDIVPGERLPAERELAVRFGVSRSSLRQALKVLENMGVLSQRVGQGTHVNADMAEILNDPLEFLVIIDGISSHELQEARMIVEPELAAMAAERASEEHLAALRKCLQAMQQYGADPDQRVEHDMAFHRIVHVAAGNRICARMFHGVHRAMQNTIALMARTVSVEHALAFHEPIYEAIYRRKPDEARESMLRHLSDGREHMLQIRKKRGE